MIWLYLLAGYSTIGILWAEFCNMIYNHMHEQDKALVNPSVLYLISFLLWPFGILFVIFSKG